MTQIYDRLGEGYIDTRIPDARIAQHVTRALGDARSVANVGAGAGAYEPDGLRVVAVEPSSTMIRQRPQGRGPAVRALAEGLPLADDSVDAALAVLTLHHWRDATRGLAEMRRVARRRAIVLAWDQAVCESFWLVRDYLPAVGAVDRRKAVPIDDIRAGLGGGDAQVYPVLVPHDCTDGFLGAFWRRPEAYLDPRVRAGISSIATLSARDLEPGLARLQDDLESGAWRERNAELLDRSEVDIGYRLVVVSFDKG